MFILTCLAFVALDVLSANGITIPNGAWFMTFLTIAISVIGAVLNKDNGKN